jgi:hypothetical protein
MQIAQTRERLAFVVLVFVLVKLRTDCWYSSGPDSLSLLLKMQDEVPSIMHVQACFFPHKILSTRQADAYSIEHLGCRLAGKGPDAATV